MHKREFAAHHNPREGHDETARQAAGSAERGGNRQGYSCGSSRLRRRSRIVLEGLRGENSIAELCRKEGIAQNLYYRWSKEFLEAGKKGLAGDAAREATSDEVKTLRT